MFFIGQEHLEAPPKQLLLAQTEDYVEYSRHGTVIKGAEKAMIKSRYEEDVYPNNHTVTTQLIIDPLYLSWACLLQLNLGIVITELLLFA